MLIRYNGDMRLRKDGRPVGTLDRCPKNEVEKECYEKLHKIGFNVVTKRGMPDFMAINWETGEFALIECKRNGGKLSNPQFILFNFLKYRYGVPCYYYSPKLGLRPFVKLTNKSKQINKQHNEEVEDAIASI